jgi:RNA polymerase sigma-70 factor (ECF subfamily)
MESTLTTTRLGIRLEGGLAADEFEDLVREHQSRIYRVLWCELRDEDAAATLTQECFLHAYRNRAGFRGEANVSTWLIRIALNLACDYRRSRRQSFWRALFGRERNDLDSAPSPASSVPSAERTLIARQKLEAVMRVVSSLPAQQRTAFTLRFVEELSMQEVAAVMGLEEGTVKSHLSRALSKVRGAKREG